MATKRIEGFRQTIEYLYCQKGVSKSEISRILFQNRRSISNAIDEWELRPAQKRRLTPSNRKFLAKHLKFIKSRLDRDFDLTEIAEDLGCDYLFLKRTIIENNDILQRAFIAKENRARNRAEQARKSMMEKSSYEYVTDDIEGERWEGIMGYPGYFVSDHGRIKSYVKTYDKFKLLTVLPNVNNNRLYVWIDGHGLQVARLVGFAFVEGYSKECCTIEHNDNNVQNNHYLNLKWVSQSVNNKLAYKKGREKAAAYNKHGRFKKILLDDKWEFKSIRSFAKFLNLSETQASRYIDDEVSDNPYKIKLIY